MSFSKHLLSSVLLAGTVFAAGTIPLVTYGSKPVAIQLEGRPVFTGQFKELAAPYVGLILALSIGAGVTNMAVMRWLESSRKVNSLESQVATLQQQLNQKETLLENLKFSPTRLQSAGLEKFLQDEALASRLQRSQIASNGEAGKNERPFIFFKSLP